MLKNPDNYRHMVKRAIYHDILLPYGVSKIASMGFDISLGMFGPGYRRNSMSRHSDCFKDCHSAHANAKGKNQTGVRVLFCPGEHCWTGSITVIVVAVGGILFESASLMDKVEGRQLIASSHPPCLP